MTIATVVARGARVATVYSMAISPAVATGSCARRGWGDRISIVLRGCIGPRYTVTILSTIF
jgi:hypothetical protein